MTCALSRRCSQECIITSPAHLKSSLCTLCLFSPPSFLNTHTHTRSRAHSPCVHLITFTLFIYHSCVSSHSPLCLFDCAIINGIAAVRTFALNYQPCPRTPHCTSGAPYLQLPGTAAAPHILQWPEPPPPPAVLSPPFPRQLPHKHLCASDKMPKLARGVDAQLCFSGDFWVKCDDA